MAKIEFTILFRFCVFLVTIASKIIGVDKIVTFTIGLPDSPDVIAAKKVINYLNIKNYHIIDFDINDGFGYLKEVIKTIESYDITTIRASTPQYIMAKYISEKTTTPSLGVEAL
mgnify:CR=1 FL=1